MKVLVTGVCGFIGYHLAKKLLHEGFAVVGIDNINDYYNVTLKFDRLTELGVDIATVKGAEPIHSAIYENFTFHRVDLNELEYLNSIFANNEFSYIYTLAAQAGVRYSLQQPQAYIDSNISGFLNILELARKYPPKHLIFASSSSVYGQNQKVPFSENDPVDHPISLYAASKRTNELMAHTYSHLFGIRITGLRFFTVYGPWGRPDMAPVLFANAIQKGDALKIFNNGNMKRDFTYIDDIVECAFRILESPPQPGGIAANPGDSWAPYRVVNIGRGTPMDLMEFIHLIEANLNKTAILEMLPMQPGDVPITWADTQKLQRIINYNPKVNLAEGVAKFCRWYMDYYGK